MKKLILGLVFVACFPAFFLVWGNAWLMAPVIIVMLVSHFWLAILETTP